MDDSVPTLQDIITVGDYFSNCVGNESFKYVVNKIFLIATNRIVCVHDHSNFEKYIDSFMLLVASRRSIKWYKSIK